MPTKFLKLFRKKKADTQPVKLSSGKSKSNDRSGNKKNGIFRRQGSMAAKYSSLVTSNNNNNNTTNTDSSSVPVQQSLTWSMSEDSVESTNLLSTRILPSLLEEKEHTLDVSSSFVFTEEELIQNELNHIRALSALQQEIDQMVDLQANMVLQHHQELAKKDDDYVELMIVAAQTEDRAKELYIQLATTKEDLAKVSCKLLQTQHELFENMNSSWRSVFN